MFEPRDMSLFAAGFLAAVGTGAALVASVVCYIGLRPKCCDRREGDRAVRPSNCYARFQPPTVVLADPEFAESKFTVGITYTL